MKITNLINGFKGVLAFAVAMLMVEVLASDAPLPSDFDDATELKQTIDELEQALVLIKQIEENKEALGEDSVFAISGEINSQNQGFEEVTEQDKLIAKMAQRLNDSAGLSNQDGSVVVSGQCLSHQDKLILKTFVEGIREQLEKITGLKFPSSAYRILVMGAVPKSRKEDTKTAQYKISIVPDAMTFQDAATIRLIIHHPSAMDSYEFAENVIRGYLALYTHVLREEKYDGLSTEPPKWFIKGLARQIDFSAQQDDTNEVLYMWSKALIPSVDKLTIEDSVLTQNNDALSSAIVGFWLDCNNPKDRLRTLFSKLANGVKWTPELYRETIRPNISPEELDDGFDYWLLAQRFKILRVGSSSEGLAKRIITHLMFVPGCGIVPESVGPKWIALHPSELAKFKDQPWAKKLAERNQRFILIASTGRNDEFRTATVELSSFYQAIIDGKASEAELIAKFIDAEKMLFAAITDKEN